MIVELIEGPTDVEVRGALQVCLYEHLIARKAHIGLAHPVRYRYCLIDGHAHLFAVFVGFPVQATCHFTVSNCSLRDWSDMSWTLDTDSPDKAPRLA